MSKLTHIDSEGRARMVDVSDKPATAREAVASGFVRMSPETLALAVSGSGRKGDVRAVAEFFHTGRPPIDPAESIEVMEFIEAAQLSHERGGKKVMLQETRR